LVQENCTSVLVSPVLAVAVKPLVSAWVMTGLVPLGISCMLFSNVVIHFALRQRSSLLCGWYIGMPCGVCMR